MSVTVRRVGPESAGVVTALVREAFANRPVLDPPADALAETEESIATRLALGGGLVARVDGEPVGCLLLDGVGQTLFLRRFGVRESARGHGVAAMMVESAVEAANESATGFTRLAVLARQELPQTVAFWGRRGFEEVARPTPYVEMVRPLPQRLEPATAEAMRDLGRRLAGVLRAGDVVMLSGDLGAGKTTFTQGLGAGLGVVGAVTSPTFVIAREHPVAGDGPMLVHVDAYRLGDAAELDDLDLDTDLDQAVTVVEWGSGKAEALSPDRLEIRISRVPPPGESAHQRADSTPELAESAHQRADSTSESVGEWDGDEPRLVEIVGVGPRWAAAWPPPVRG